MYCSREGPVVCVFRAYENNAILVQNERPQPDQRRIRKGHPLPPQLYV
jgi:hypothetical protein